MNIEERTQYIATRTLTKDLEKNLESIKHFLGNSYDLQIRKFKVGKEDISAAVVYISGLEDAKLIERIVENLTAQLAKTSFPSHTPEAIYETALKSILTNESTLAVKDLDKIFDNIFFGDTLLIIQGVDKGILCATKDIKTRALEEPQSESVIRGTRDGFIESIQVNTSLIRRRIRSPNLWIESMEIGTITKTQVAFAYLKGLAQEDLVAEVRSRLKAIDIDGIFESGQIEDFIEDTHLTLYPLTQRTERTDIVVANILEGRVAIFTDGTPFVLIIPITFFELLQSPDDYVEKFPIGTFIRGGRHVAFMISMFFPAAYVAVINFHPELIPNALLQRITASRQGVPFPAVIEVFMMEFVIELLREAGLRLPKMIGPAVSIVGALILGDAAIQAGLVSPAVVIVVSFTAIASFATPVFSLSIAGRVTRFMFILLGGIFGLFGVQFGFILLAIHFCALRSFGQPYFSPLAPMIIQDMKDYIISLPWTMQKTRPKLIGGRSPFRQERKASIKQPEGLDKNQQEKGNNLDERGKDK